MASQTTLNALPDVCGILKVSRATVYRLVAEKKLAPPVKISARRVAWREADIDSFIAGLAAGV